jgi:hypothetical protein
MLASWVAASTTTWPAAVLMLDEELELLELELLELLELELLELELPVGVSLPPPPHAARPTHQSTNAGSILCRICMTEKSVRRMERHRGH